MAQGKEDAVFKGVSALGGGIDVLGKILPCFYCGVNGILCRLDVL